MPTLPPEGEKMATTLPITLHVERQALGAAIDGGIGLDIAVVGAALPGVALDRGNDPAGHRAAEAEGIADRDNPVARARLAAVAEFDIGEGLAPVHLEHSKVGLRIGADEICLVFSAIGHRHGDFFHRAAPGRADNVVVGDDIAIC